MELNTGELTVPVGLRGRDLIDLKQFGIRIMTRSAARFYLFLDVDGVLHRMTFAPDGEPRLPRDELLLSRLPLLEKTIRPHLEHLEIIVSSSWRLHPGSWGPCSMR